MEDISKLSFAELYSMFKIVSDHIDRREYSWCNKEMKTVITDKFNELRLEIYNRIYGCNPFEGAKNPSVITK